MNINGFVNNLTNVYILILEKTTSKQMAYDHED